MQTYGPETILFNELPLTDINFFDFSIGSATIKAIRENIAIWYYALRNLAIGLLLAMLIYVGIRMALSTVASEEAKYKKMLKDWVVSFVLVFLLQYIIIFTINCNNGLVAIMNAARQNVTAGSFDNVINNFATQALGISFVQGLGSSIVFCILVGMTLSFLIFYIKRMLTIGFLIVIAPIVTITYSIDKMGDNKSQALDKWLKEFVYTILIQPFQCLIYLIFAITALDVMKDNSIGSAVLGVVMILFIHQAEDIVRSIFSFEHAHSLGSTLTTMALASTMTKAIGKVSDAKKGASEGKAKAAGPVDGKDKQNKPKKKLADRKGPVGALARTKAGQAATKAGEAVSKKAARAKAGAARLKNTPVGKYLGLSAKGAAMIAGAAMGAGVSGNGKGAAAGGALGMGIAGMAGGAWQSMSDKQASKDAEEARTNAEKLKEPQENTAKEYHTWAQRTGLDPSSAAPNAQRIVQRVLAGEDMSSFDRTDRDFAQSISNLETAYKDIGVSSKNMESQIMNTINKIQNGEINPPA